MRLFYIIVVLFSGTFAIQSKVHYLDSDNNNNYICDSLWKNVPNIYCYKGKPKNIVHIWETIQLHLSLSSDEFEQFDGFSPEEVLSKIQNEKSSWNFNFYKTKKKVIKLNPFNDTCIGVITDSEYNIKLTRIRVDYWRILTFVSGIGLFLLAPKLSSNSLFYYICGVSFGTCASLLILIFIISRLLPKKPMMYSFLVGGWTIGLYLVQFLWDNIRTIALEYQSYVFYYIIATGILSFIICYRIGPVSDPRSINIIKWLMQAFGLGLILMSSDFKEATLAFDMLILACYLLPFGSFLRFSKKCFRWYRPKPRPLLSEDEYHHQGVIETEKALEELRGYCSSPECNQWKTVLKLRNPMRFAKFVEGSSHLLDEEVLSFETDVKQSEFDDLLTDDSSSSTD
ncbi:nuclear envelope integral membrane protein isoform X2 [Halyomorpha halys]|uniref:nuclear envelope integral membrane protein isoform X2 n=1 Tax=Halyomorpha halys TaxID=286706 RepID=UPI0006D511A6|nr:nuclear envelope integral membrane protein 1 isoform X2 [Halyomorpha halys]